MLRPIHHDLPRCSWLARLVGTTLLRLSGWKLVGDPPANTKKAVCIAVPHTSNWDFWWALLTCWSAGMSFQWLGKDSLFQSPLGPLLRYLGGISVDRSHASGLVAAVAEQLRAADRMLLMVPAEGSRSRRETWKSGFYHIAREGGVPLVLGYLDYPRRHAGFGPVLHLTGDLAADMDVMRAFYTGKVGKYPDAMGPMRLAGEGEPPSP